MMARRILPILQYLIAALIVSVGLTALVLWPATRWMVVKTVHIADTPKGAPVEMIVDRSVVRPFTGQYNVSIHAWHDNAWVAYCNTAVSNPWEYQAGARYPVPLTLEWWTGGKCHPLPPGEYQVTTRWNLSNLGIFPDKTFAVTSNIFEIKP
jgi:hypothetical protein